MGLSKIFCHTVKNRFGHFTGSISIPDNCHFWYATTFFRPVKGMPKKCVNSRKKIVSRQNSLTEYFGMQIHIFYINYFNRDQEKITYLVFCLVYFVFCLAYLVFGVCGVLFGVHYIFWRTLCILRRNWCLWHWDVVFLTFIWDGASNTLITKNVQI